MYYISRDAKPDIQGMKATMEGLMAHGIRIANCEDVLQYYTNNREALKDKIKNSYGINNPNSSAQITAKLEELSDSEQNYKDRNPIIENCFDERTHKWTSKAEALEKLADLGYTFAQDILSYRKYKKYADSIEGMLKARDSDGLVHPTVTLAKTNRIQYSNPGILTIPKDLLWKIIAPYKQGDVLFSADIKNQEPSILINFCGADELKPALSSPDGLYETMFKSCFKPRAKANVFVGIDLENRAYDPKALLETGRIQDINKLYAEKPGTNSIYYNNKQVTEIQPVCLGGTKGERPNLPDTVVIETSDGHTYRVPVKWHEEDIESGFNKNKDYTILGDLDDLEVKINKIERKEFKTSWNAISYGSSIQGVKSICKVIDGTKVYKYITGISQLKTYRSAISKWARGHNTRIKTVFGTQLDAGAENQYDVKRLERILLDLPIQGTGADILSLLIKHFYEYTKQNGLDGKLEIYYTRHDELIIEANGEWVRSVGIDKVTSILHDMLEHQIADWVPFKMDIGPVSSNVGELDSFDIDEDE